MNNYIDLTFDSKCDNILGMNINITKEDIERLFNLTESFPAPIGIEYSDLDCDCRLMKSYTELQHSIFHIYPDKNTDISIQGHRVSHIYFNTNDPLTRERNQVRHKCDRRNCVEPTHLCAGSAKENSQDKVDRGRVQKQKQKSLKLPKKTKKYHLLVLNDDKVHFFSYF